MTDILATIDAVVSTWEAAPESWVPGDLLHDHPYHREDVGGGDVVRPMFEVLPEYSRSARCQPCGVYWRGPEPCWVCGEARPGQPLLDFSVAHSAETFALAAAQVQRSLRELEAALAVIRRRDRAQLAMPRPLPIDGREYHRRRIGRTHR